VQVFLVDVSADKKKIRKAVQNMYDIQTKKINTLIRCAQQQQPPAAAAVARWLRRATI
jgi:ribosomal protein L23